MGLQGFSSGWSGVDDYDSNNGDGGGGGGSDSMSRNERLYRYRFSVPDPGVTEGRWRNLVPGNFATKRVMFLSGEPFKVYEHGLWSVKDAYRRIGSFFAMCTSRNPIVRGKKCPLCENLKGRDRFPSFVGVFPVIDMGQVEYRGGKTVLHHDSFEDDNGNIVLNSFRTKLLAAKRGSQDKPGVLITLSNQLNKIRAQKGIDSLLGTVWDTTRGGKKEAGIGSTWEYVERVEPDDFADYLVNLGADRERLDLDPVVFHSEDGTGVFDVNPDEYYGMLESLFVDDSSSGNDRFSKSGGYSKGYSSRTDNGPNRPDGEYPMPGDDDIPF